MLIDTHCHLFKNDYDNINRIIEDAKKNQVHIIIVNGCDRSSNLEVLELTKEYDNVYGTIGYHPSEIDNLVEADYNIIITNLNNPKIIGIGEIGLDYHYDTNRNKQQELFKRQLEIAIMYHKPVIVHSRDAITDTYEIMKSYTGLKGILHCYSGSLEMAHKFIDLGIYLGIGGIITYKNAKKLVAVVKAVDCKWLVLETDSPYLTPEPYRKYKNEPKYIKNIALKIAELKGLDYNYIADVTTSNVYDIFDF